MQERFFKLLCFGDTQLRIPRSRSLAFALLTVFLSDPVFVARYCSDGHACLPFSWFVKSAICIRMAFSGGLSPSAFTALISKVFNSRKNFITELEKLVLEFYDLHTQHLKQWVPKAPKPIENQVMADETK